MREIKFRGIAKGILQDRWMYGHYYVDDDYGVHVVDFCIVDPETIGQFTGLHDCNGKEIYEGDILKLDLTDWCGVSEDIFKVSSKYFHGDITYLESILNDSDNDHFEVIGNIHEQGSDQ